MDPLTTSIKALGTALDQGLTSSASLVQLYLGKLSLALDIDTDPCITQTV